MTIAEAGRRALTRATAALVIAASGCVAHRNAGEPIALEGCHYFVQDDVAAALRLPWGVRLLDEPLEGWPAIQQREGVRRATTLTGEGDRRFPFGYWIRTSPDSVEIGYPAGGGLVLDLAMDNGLSGVAREVGDALPMHGDRRARSHVVELIRARCPEDA
jgi:hypothetical protein